MWSNNMQSAMRSSVASPSPLAGVCGTPSITACYLKIVNSLLTGAVL
jgi:hypothetical protein